MNMLKIKSVKIQHVRFKLLLLVSHENQHGLKTE